MKDRTFSGDTKELTRIFKLCFNRNDTKIPKYKGQLAQSSDILACNFNIDWHFTKEGLEYHKERGMELENILVMCIYQLGYDAACMNKEPTSDLLHSFIKAHLKELDLC